MTYLEKLEDLRYDPFKLVLNMILSKGQSTWDEMNELRKIINKHGVYYGITFSLDKGKFIIDV